MGFSAMKEYTTTQATSSSHYNIKTQKYSIGVNSHVFLKSITQSNLTLEIQV